MEAALADSFIQARQPFVDGFGERRMIIDARGDCLNLLRLKNSLATTPSFEMALRERVIRLAGFQHPSYSHVRTIEAERSSGTLAIVSDHVAGARLSTLLAASERRKLSVDLPAVACIIRQLVFATTAWREQMPDIVHGALSPDRLIVTPDGRVVVVEYVLGSAIEQLRYSPQQYWEELGVAVPATFKFAINAQADVLQVGAVALALLLGRRLKASDRLSEIPSDLRDAVPVPLRTWLLRALQLEPVGSFTSVLDARAALDAAFGPENQAAEQDALLLFMARCLALDVDTPQSSDSQADAPGRTDDLPDVDLSTRIEALRTFLARRSARREAPLREEPPPAVPSVAPSPADQTSPEPWHRADIPPEPEPAPVPSDDGLASSTEYQKPRRITLPALPPDWTRYVWIAAATVLAIGAALFALILGVFPSSNQPAIGGLSIETRPPGVAVSIDGTPRGVTPLALDLEAGDHVIELVSNSDRRRIPVTIREGSQTSQFLEMGSVAVRSATELRIRTEPLGAEITVDGQYVGRSPVSVPDLAPGPHTVVLKHQSGTTTEQVLIEEGKSASLFVPLAAPQPATAAGWISVPSPIDVQLFENGRLLGSSSVERIMLPAGSHDLHFVNEVLGFSQRQTVRVTAGQVSTIKLAWPTGNLAINAVPWAQAFVDGRSVGETPIGNIQVPIGPHEIVFRHPQLGERTVRVTVTTRETAKVGVDLRTK